MMQRRNFLKESALVVTAAVTASGAVHASAQAQKEKSSKELYEWRRYFFPDTDSKWKFDQFCAQYLLPRFSGLGIKGAAFFEEPEAQDAKPSPLTMHFMTVYTDIAQYQEVKARLFEDKTFLEQSAAFYEETAVKPLYSRFETFLLEAFENFPKLSTSPDRRLFQMRLYESPNEEAGQRKIKMFNSGEMSVFKEVGLNIAFFGEILSGPQMPGLLYSLSFKDMAECRAAWGRFGSHPRWKAMDADPAFKNTVSKVNNVYLTPRSYSTL